MYGTDARTETRRKLLDAAFYGRLDEVKSCLETNLVDVNTADDQRITILMKAVSRGAIDIVKFLLDKNANVHAVDFTGKTALMYSIKQPEITKLLLQKGARVNDKTTVNQEHGGLTALMCSFYFSSDKPNTEVVKLLLDAGANVNDTHIENKHVVTIIAQASATGCAKSVELVLSKKPNNIDRVSWIRHCGNHTPLTIAAKYHHLEVIKILIKEGANVDVNVPNVGTALISVLFKEPEPIEIVKEFLQANANVDEQYGFSNPITPLRYEDTALMVASSKGYSNIVSLLLSKGADLHIRTYEGRTALSKAKTGEIVELLLAKGAKINELDNNKMTPLQHAMKEKNLSVAKMLLEKSANVNKDDNLFKDFINYELEYVGSRVYEIDYSTADLQKKKAVGESVYSYTDLVAIIKFLLQRGVQPGYRYDTYSRAVNYRAKGQEALVSVFNGNHQRIKKRIDAIKILLSLGATLPEGSENERKLISLLVQTACSGDLEAYKYLTKFFSERQVDEIDIKAVNDKFLSLLNEAINTCDLNATKNILSQINLKIEMNNNNKQKLFEILWKAISDNDLQAVKLLVKAGIKGINEKNSMGATLLMHAVAQGNIELVNIFFDKDALHCTNDKGENVFDIATRCNHTSIIELLKPHFKTVSTTTTANSSASNDFLPKGLSTKPLPQPKKLLQASAIDDYQATDNQELSFNKGDILTVLNQDPSGWWLCQLNQRQGIAPSSFLIHLNQSSNVTTKSAITSQAAHISSAQDNNSIQQSLQSNITASVSKATPPASSSLSPSPSIAHQYVPFFSSSQPGASAPISSSPNVINSQGQVQVSLAIPTHDIKVSSLLGKGGFGEVYKGTWQHTKVAIKRLLLTQMTEKVLQEFKTEASRMATLRHPNIIQLFGVTLDKQPYCMIMELASNGSLYSYLHSSQPLDDYLRVNIALDIAAGLAYLHNCKILHRDLKSGNILLDGQMKAKLADFGLSLVKTETASLSHASSEAAGTLMWMAPELFRRKTKYTTKCDIYSTGMVFWEIVSREMPYQDARGNSSLITQWVIQGDREEIPEDCPQVLKSLIEDCWEGNPEKRPTAEEVVKQLQMVASTSSSDSMAAYSSLFSSHNVESKHFNQSTNQSSSSNSLTNNQNDSLSLKKDGKASHIKRGAQS